MTNSKRKMASMDAEDMSSKGDRGNGNFKNDREKASKAGRKGGQR